jgi:DNA-binding transcriptional regulator YdaS (Cro superfamily)
MSTHAMKARKPTAPRRPDPGIQAIDAKLSENAKLGIKPASWLELADLIGVTRQAVGQWRNVPAKHIVALETILDLSRAFIRPDLYPPSMFRVPTEGAPHDKSRRK